MRTRRTSSTAPAAEIPATAPLDNAAFEKGIGDTDTLDEAAASDDPDEGSAEPDEVYSM